MKRLLLTCLIALSGCDSKAITADQIKGEIVFGADASKTMPSDRTRFNYPEDAVESSDGSIYISDTQLHVIRVMKDGEVKTFAGTFNAGYSGDGDRISTTLNTPTGLLIEYDQEHLVFADSGNALIRRINIKNGNIETIAGLQGITNQLPEDGDKSIGSPIGYVSALKYDNDGRICYASSKMSEEKTAIGGGIYCISSDGITQKLKINESLKLDGVRDFLITEKYTYILRSTDLHQVSRDGQTRSISLPIQHGKGLVPDGDGVIVGLHSNIYKITDDLQQSTISSGFANVSNIKRYSNGLLVVDSDQGVLYALNGTTKTQITGWNDDAIGALTSVAKYKKGKLLILDNQRPRIFIYDIKSGKASVWAGTGNQGWASIDVDKLSTTFYYPTSIAVDNNLNVYVSEQHRIMRIDENGRVSRFAGYEKPGDIDSQNPEDARFQSIGGMSYSDDGSLYVADTHNNKIRKISKNGEVSTFAGTGETGSPVNGEHAATSKLNQPLGVSALENGDVLISDSWNNSIIRVDEDGNVHHLAGKQYQAIYQGMGSYSGDNGPALESGLNTPASTIADSHGNLYISDHFNHRIRMVSQDGKITTIAGESQGFSPNGKKLNFPNGLQVIDGYLYVADSGNRVVLKFNIE